VIYHLQLSGYTVANSEGGIDNYIVDSVEICEGDFEPDGDVDGGDLAHLIDTDALEIDIFAEDFGRTDCLE
jgi:hypothetical protein